MNSAKSTLFYTLHNVAINVSFEVNISNIGPCGELPLKTIAILMKRFVALEIPL